MSLIVSGYNLEEDIRQHNFANLVRIYRAGKAGELTLKEQNLLADYHEEKLKRSKGRPASEGTYDLAKHLFSECRSLREYGKTSDEVATFISENYDQHGKSVLNLLKGHGLSRKDAISKLAEIHIMGEKNVERLVDLGRKIDEYEEELHADVDL